jgi:hypothetical protein
MTNVGTKKQPGNPVWLARLVETISCCQIGSEKANVHGRHNGLSLAITHFEIPIPSLTGNLSRQQEVINKVQSATLPAIMSR